MNTRGLLSLCILISLGITGALSGPYQTSAYVVTNTDDDGSGSLRVAITLANASPGVDSISFELDGTILLGSALPAITEDLTIDGGGHAITIDGQSAYRILEVAAGVSVKLAELALVNGYSAADGGAILNAGALEIQACRLEGSLSLAGGAIYSSGKLMVGGGTILAANQADTGGGIFSSGNLYIEDASFTGNAAISLEGGAIYAIGPTASLANVTFTENTAINEGAGIYRRGDLSISGTLFSGNHGWGGAVYHRDGVLSLENTGFANNIADADGAAIVTDSRLVITGGHFTGNTAMYGSGGAINLLAGSLAAIQGASFENNTSATVGGAIYMPDGTSLSLRDVILENNRAAQVGGAIWSSGVLDLDSVRMTANHAPTSGGGIMNLGSLVVRRSTISGNTSINQSGAIDNPANSSLILIDSTLDHNQAAYGGAILNRGSLELTNTTFEANDGDNAGAMYNYSTISLNQVKFIDNSAFDGGALINRGEAQIIDSLFQGNHADGDFGGAIINGGGMRIDNTTFAGNHVQNGGGAITNGGQLEITNSLFSGNGTKWGGAINNTSATTTMLRGVTFEYNYAGHWGGAILNSGNMLVEDCLFNANRAEEFGGGVHNEGALTVRSSLFYQNTSGRSGGGVENWGTLALENATLSGNIASYQGGAALRNSGSASLNYVTVADNIINDIEGVGAINNTGALEIAHTILAGTQGSFNCTGLVSQASPNLSDDDSCPGFTVADARLGPLQNNGGPTSTHALLPGSPAVDSASDPLCPAADQRGEPRPQGLGCDLGAFEAGSDIVLIDIRPKSATNIIDLSSSGTIPVAVLSAPGFYAPGQVDAASLTFGAQGWEVSPVVLPPTGKLLCSGWDVNGDQLLDLICTFPVPATAFTCESQIGIVRGLLHNGDWIVGSDIITPRPCR